MRSSSDLRAAARGSLQGKWGTAIVIFLLSTMILNAVSFVSNFFSNTSALSPLINHFIANGMDIDALEALAQNPDLFTAYTPGAAAFSLFSSFLSLLSFLIGLLLTGVMLYGLAAYTLDIARGSQAGVERLWEGFKKFGDCVAVNVIVSIFTFLWSMLFVIIFFAIPTILSITAAVSGSDALISISVLLFIVLAIVFIVFVSVFFGRYAFVYYLMRDCEKANYTDYVNQSKVLMKGNYMRYFTLGFSFIGWILLCILTCGIGFIVLNPYIRTAMAHFYNDCLVEGMSSGKLTFVRLREANNTNQEQAQYPQFQNPNGIN